jgi:mRNA-degrading endonuclease RelE of RelBE toxin-antitoxin system
MENTNLPILPKNWEKLGWKKVKKETKESEFSEIQVKDLEIGGVYQNHVKDLVKVLEINNETKTVLFYNISGAHKQWISFKNIALVEKKY